MNPNEMGPIQAPGLSRERPLWTELSQAEHVQSLTYPAALRTEVGWLLPSSSCRCPHALSSSPAHLPPSTAYHALKVHL